MDEVNNKEKHYLGHRMRLRERFVKGGPDSLQEYEIVELLLTYVVTQKDVKPIAKELLDKFGSVKGIFEASEEELQTVPFIKDKFVVLLKLIREINTIYRKQKLMETSATNTMESIADYCIERFGDKTEEEFHVIYFDSKLNILYDSHFPTKEFYVSGTTDRTAVYPRTIIEKGLKDKAYGMILAHNHPNGKLQPSDPDINITKVIEIAAKSVGMVLYDHLIVSSTGYLSFKKEGLL
jgi:DNA repair protein RadC